MCGYDECLRYEEQRRRIAELEKALRPLADHPGAILMSEIDAARAALAMPTLREALTGENAQEGGQEEKP